ncbi:MAG: 30S ribosomal protein S3 [Clostridiales bacterium]|nr:30S ribosomal protein S3 [Clostridiales bacterium]
MGQKVHPKGFRLGIIYNWDARWYAGRNYAQYVQEDLKIRDFVRNRLKDAGVSRVEIERAANKLTVIIHTARPGVVIGRGGQEVDQLRRELEKLTGRQVKVDIVEIKQPELDAQLVAEGIAMQLARRVAFRRAIKQALQRVMRARALGCKIKISGRLGGAEMRRTEWVSEGSVPLHTIKADIDYGFAEAYTTYGQIGVKVWIYKGVKDQREAQLEASPAGEEVS